MSFESQVDFKDELEEEEFPIMQRAFNMELPLDTFTKVDESVIEFDKTDTTEKDVEYGPPKEFGKRDLFQIEIIIG